MKTLINISCIFLLMIISINVSAQMLERETQLKLDAKHAAAVKISHHTELVSIIAWYYKASEEIKKSERCSFLILNNLARAAGSHDNKTALDCINTSLVYNEGELYGDSKLLPLEVSKPRTSDFFK